LRIIGLLSKTTESEDGVKKSEIVMLCPRALVGLRAKYLGGCFEDCR
jgi:hypothetical protein